MDDQQNELLLKIEKLEREKEMIIEQISKNDSMIRELLIDPNLMIQTDIPIHEFLINSVQKYREREITSFDSIKSVYGVEHYFKELVFEGETLKIKLESGESFESNDPDLYDTLDFLAKVQGLMTCDVVFK